jgi:molybdopterin-guanine dinucleotide biosynthesis protein A
LNKTIKTIRERQTLTPQRVASMSVEGFILAGGASSRMGTDKSRLVFGGQSAIDRIADGLSAITGHIGLVGAHDEDRQSAFVNIPDIHEHWGALGGIHAALHASQAEWAVIVACDLPFVTGELFTRLWSLGKCDAPTFEAVVPIQADGRPQPLCALYRRESCLKKADELIGGGEHTPRALLAAVSTRWVQSEELSDLRGARHFFINVNTPADYERAKEILARSDAANRP